jgi:hypothetical protein
VGAAYCSDYRRRHPGGLPLPSSHAPHFDGTRLIKILRGHADRREVGAVWRNFQAGAGNGLVHFAKFANDLAGGRVDESDYLVGARSDHLLAVGGEVNRQWLQEEIAIFRNKLPGVRVTNANDRVRVGRADGCTVARKSQRNRATGNRSGFPECRCLVARAQLEVARGTQESFKLQGKQACSMRLKAGR